MVVIYILILLLLLWCKHSITNLIDFLNEKLNYNILSINENNRMIKINPYFHILNFSDRI
jgi:hypothetical protein